MIVKIKSIGKWVTDIRSDDPVGVAARATLQSRLKAVRCFLELAATRWQEDVEHVHQLRVHSRRCLAAIKMYQQVLPERERKQLLRWLNEIRRAAGDARDLDVLLLKYRQTDPQTWPSELSGFDRPQAVNRFRKRLCRQIKKRRRKAQKPIVKLHQRLQATGRLKQRCKQLLKGIPSQPSPDGPSFEAFAHDRFADALGRFVASTPKAGASLEEWHRFRIRGKQLRYTMELVSVLYDRDFRNGLYPCISQLQEHLGLVTDHATASDFLSGFQRHFKKERDKRIVEAMIAREKEQFAVSLVEFQSWWMADASAELKPWIERYRSPSLAAD